MTYSAYVKTGMASENPRETEVRLLGEITHALEASANSELSPQLVEAVHRNTLLWNAVVADLAHEENKLPDQLKASLISIGLWVHRHSANVLRKEAALDALIDVNKKIMRGLIARPDAAAGASPSA